LIRLTLLDLSRGFPAFDQVRLFEMSDSMWSNDGPRSDGYSIADGIEYVVSLLS
jgi:hypothetical protein